MEERRAVVWEMRGERRHLGAPSLESERGVEAAHRARHVQRRPAELRHVRGWAGGSVGVWVGVWSRWGAACDTRDTASGETEHVLRALTLFTAFTLAPRSMRICMSATNAFCAA